VEIYTVLYPRKKKMGMGKIFEGVKDDPNAVKPIELRNVDHLRKRRELKERNLKPEEKDAKPY
jgi:hypothetical protein